MELAIGYITAGLAVLVTWTMLFVLGMFMDIAGARSYRSTTMENAVIATICVWATLGIVLLQFYWDA
jgi:hypothetical protein